jgi:hypothetical protein
MPTQDDREAYILELLEQAPPLTPEAAELVVRILRKTTDTSSPVSGAA